MELNFESTSALVGIAIIFVVLCIVILTIARRSYIVARERRRMAGFKQATEHQQVPSYSTAAHTRAHPGSDHLRRRSSRQHFIANLAPSVPPTHTTAPRQVTDNPFFPTGLRAW